MSRRKEQAEQSKAHLVETALRLFVAQGYEATSVSQILDEAGMARGALYHHFPEGKRELFAEAVDVANHDFHEGLDRIVTTVTSPVEMIAAGWKLVLDLATEPVFAKIVLVEAPLVMPLGWSGGEQYLLMRAILEEAVTAGEIRPLPLDALAATLFGAVRRMADFVAVADDPARTAREGGEVLQVILDALRA